MFLLPFIGTILRSCLHPSPQRRSRAIIFCLALLPAWATADPLDIRVLYLQQHIEKPPALSNILPEPDDAGIRGAELAINDNNTAGRFLRQHYALKSFVSGNAEELRQHALRWIAADQRLIVADVTAATLRKLTADPALAGEALVFNVSAAENNLRTQSCQSGLLHTTPSHAMLSDALMQFLVRKRWQDWFLIKGGRPEDTLVAASLKRSAKKFGARLVQEKTWSFDTDLRRSAAQEIPAFTQAKDYDVIVTADEAGDFGEYIPYNSWLPRPVAGTQGLTPVTWHRVVEQWGAAQLQSRFEKLAGRWMNSRDYSAWLAVRAIAEAVTRTSSTDYHSLYAYLLGPEFELAGFKGRKLSFRNWNGQMRQPIPLVHPRALVANAPLEGFLHPHSELDTLGFDRPEVNCSFTTTLPGQ